jgi:hypothetical protein
MNQVDMNRAFAQEQLQGGHMVAGTPDAKLIISQSRGLTVVLQAIKAGNKQAGCNLSMLDS